MNRKTVLLAYTSLLLLSCVGIGFQFIKPAKASPTTWTVDDDGPADFPTIQEAINAASYGDTIYVRNGTYYENVVVNNSVLIIGENKEKTTINGNGAGTVVTVVVDNVTLSELTMENGHYGIYVVSSDNNEVTDNVIANNTHAIHLSHSDSNIISFNIISSNLGHGITISDSKNVTISDNLITSNRPESGYFAVHLQFCSCCTIRNNTISNYGRGIYLVSTNQTVVHKNVVISNRYEGIHFSGEATDLAKGGYNIITNNLVSENDQGFSFGHTIGNVIMANMISNNSLGFYLYGFGQSTIHHNNIVYNMDQVYISAVSSMWDDGYPSGGNYWSDYTGVDLYSGPNQDIPGSDGIGDISYVIDADNIDRYPLMNPWAPIETSVKVKGKDYPVTIVSNTTIEKIVATKNILHFKSSGPTGETGYILVVFPMVNTTEIKVFIDGGPPLTPPPFPVINSNGTHYFIYFEFTLSTHDIQIEFAPLAPLVPVGGVWVPINKFELLAPWIGLASLIAVATMTIGHVKHRKKKQT